MDNTTQLITDYKGKYSNIRYFRNEENIGALKNFMKLPEYAQGEYIWFLSDDDMMSDIAIQEIKNTIYAYKPEFILSDMF